MLSLGRASSRQRHPRPFVAVVSPGLPRSIVRTEALRRTSRAAQLRRFARARLVLLKRGPFFTAKILSLSFMSAEQWSAARAIAAAFLSGPWELDGMIERAGKRGRWVRGLAMRTLAAFSQPNRPSIGILGSFIAADPGFNRQASISTRVTSATPSKLQPVAGNPTTWELPQLTTPDALAEWVGISRGELDWFADRYRSARRRSPGPLSHYHYRWLPKRSGGFRLLEVPKARLKRFQAELLHGLLDRIQPHEAAHGFRSGRSIVSCASPHVGQQVVLRIDLKDFFASISAARVRGLFMTAGYPEIVARLLTGLCTNDVSDFAWQDPVLLNASPRPGFARRGSLYRRRHLPQGAPTSPALANLCAYRLDCRLQGLRARPARSTRAMPMIWSSPAARTSRLRPSISHCRLRDCIGRGI